MINKKNNFWKIEKNWWIKKIILENWKKLINKKNNFWKIEKIDEKIILENWKKLMLILENMKFWSIQFFKKSYEFRNFPTVFDPAGLVGDKTDCTCPFYHFPSWNIPLRSIFWQKYQKIAKFGITIFVHKIEKIDQ